MKSRPHATVKGEPESRLRAAIRYGQLGLRAVPMATLGPSGVCTCGCADPCCRVRGKHSMVTPGAGWDGCADEAGIRVWWKRYPEANVGIACGTSGIVVLDVDPKNGGGRSLGRLSAANGTAFLDTLTAITSNGGRHLYYIAPPGLHISTQRSRLGAGIDVIGKGLGVIAPPSIHPCGHEYRWAAEGGPESCPPKPLPEWLVDVLSNPPSVWYRCASVRWKVPNLEVRCRLRRLARRLHLAE